MEEADRLCDRVAIMDHGRILALGSPDELKRSIGADVVVRLTAEGETERVAEHMRTFPDATGANAVDGAVHLTARSASGLLPSLIAHAEQGGFRVQDLSVNEPTLETVFIHLTGKDLRD